MSSPAICLVVSSVEMQNQWLWNGITFLDMAYDVFLLLT